MTTFLKQSTAVTVEVGPFLDSTDGSTAETALTITQPDIRLSKNGGAFAQKNSSGTASHMENGYYSVSLDSTDTGTLGRLRLHVAESGALPVWMDFMVVPANVWDALFGSDKLQVDVAEWLGSAPNALQSGRVDSYVGANNDKTGYRLSATGVDDILDEAISEPSGVFTWPATLRNIVGWLGALARNKQTVSKSTGEQTLRNDDDDSDIATAAVSDDGDVFTREEWT